MSDPVTAFAHRVVRTAMQRPRTTADLSPLSGRSADDLRGTTVLITGASSGIGADAAELFAGHGANVILVARREDELALVAHRIHGSGGLAHPTPADLSDRDDVARLVEHVQSEHGVPDIVINNAGRSIRRSVLDSTDRLHDYERTMAVNYFGPVQLTLGFLDGMRSRGSGHFINVSTWGIPMGTMPRFSAYAGSKAALTVFGRSIAADLRGTGIAVSTVYFPLVRTPMISPTAEYTEAPALTSAEAARWLIHAAVHREPEVMPRIARFLRRVGAVSTDVADAMVTRGTV
ncbi:SDR family NAD(P)-dependent oxidoreductase [Williamsia sp. CHRR-6]|uniref:SDR family NAD(P)-dependent oxidoreductase n=1 Tax=Williamsia sp. CHRR-6 TaxID=2835871 RepID=UPI001BDB5E64|nr:SDR family NAD(P)-dependent oxidoreductase [Williamsia sp. CHRR-6]MBT0567701.1 SDR family NAD(P)-dependent oxidoreductase [Williamsia sp. CHRR-6]